MLFDNQIRQRRPVALLHLHRLRVLLAAQLIDIELPVADHSHQLLGLRGCIILAEIRFRLHLLQRNIGFLQVLRLICICVALHHIYEWIFDQLASLQITDDRRCPPNCLLCVLVLFLRFH